VGTAQLFGRQVETAWIEQAVRGAAQGRGSATFVVGPPGLGKTRLTEVAAEHAARHGVSVAIGRAWEAGGAPPGWPWVEALRSFGDAAVVERACGSLGLRRAHLEHLYPELAGPSRGLSDLDESGRFALLDAVVQLWVEIGAVGPCLLILEDLHAADALTADIVSLLCERVSRSPLLVLGTYRSREARLSDAVREGLARAARFAHLLELRPLTPADAEALARSTLGPDVAHDRIEDLVALCDGNPLFVRELARAAPGAVHGEGPGRALSGLDHVIAAHLRMLGPRAREVADLASVLGRELDVPLLRRAARDVLGFEDEAITGALDELVERELLIGVAPGRSAFVHVLLRDALYDRIDPVRRGQLHASALHHLEKGGAPASQRAHHALAAGTNVRLGDVVDLVRRAAADQSTAFAFADAAELLARLLAHAEATAELGPRDLAPLRLELAQVEMLGGRVSVARQICVEVARVADELEDAELLARAALIYGAEFTRGTRDRTMIELLERALDALGDVQTPLRVRVLGRCAAAQFPAPDPELPLRLANEAVAAARALGDPRTLFEVLLYARLPKFFWQPARAFLELEAETLALARRVATPAELVRVLTIGAITHLAAADLASFDALREEATAMAAHVQAPQQLFRLHLFAAMAATFRGDFDEAERMRGEARACFDRGPTDAPIPVFILSAFGAARIRRDVRACQAMRAELVRAIEGLPNAGPLLAAFHALVGDLPAVRTHVARRDADLRGRPLAILVCLAEASIALEDRALAEEIYDRMSPFGDDVVTWGLVGFTAEGIAHAWLARLAAFLGRFELARGHFERALELDEALGARPAVANTLEDWGTLHQGEGAFCDPERAADLLERAACVLDELGLNDRAAEARRRAGPLPKAREDRGPRIDGLAAGAPTLELRPDGESVVVSFGEERFSVRDAKGIRYLQTLVAVAGREVHVLELVSTDVGGRAALGSTSDAGPMLDAQAKAAYRQRLQDLQEELEEATALGDLARAEARRTELDALISELARATGLGGRDRAAASPAERARINVQKRLKAAIAALAKHSPALGRHLERAVRTGVFCAYDPPALR
jgi:tetratricopeptide (TPR) repeat protein